MDTAHWPQEMVVKPIEEIVVKNACTTTPKGTSTSSSSVVVERKPRPQKEQALNCPRCHSINTKFCYYNNYSLTQPRYFCKTCRRYWTEGGSLRNIPVGGGSRKNKRSSSNSLSSSSNISNNNNSSSLPSKLSNNNQAQDLNLAFPSSNSTTPDFTNISQLVLQQTNNSVSSPSTTTAATTTTTSSQLSAIELLNSRGLNLNAFKMPLHPVHTDPNSSVNYTNCGITFPNMQDFKPTLNFSLDGIASSGYTSTSLQGVHHETSGRNILFPFEDLKQVSSNTATMDHQNNDKEQHGDSNGYWTGMLGSGSWLHYYI